MTECNNCFEKLDLTPEEMMDEIDETVSEAIRKLRNKLEGLRGFTETIEANDHIEFLSQKNSELKKQVESYKGHVDNLTNQLKYAESRNAKLVSCLHGSMSEKLDQIAEKNRVFLLPYKASSTSEHLVLEEVDLRTMEKIREVKTPELVAVRITKPPHLG
jgi:CRISPR/Cas system CSM-associated protein Csm2 small subunit